MATLKTQIDNLVGAGLASTLYDNWLVAGARTVVDILKDEDMERHSTAVSIPKVAGLDVTLYRIWQILANGNTAIQRITGNESQVIDSNSFYKAGTLTPAYIIRAGVLKCYDGRTVAVDANNTEITLVGAGTNYDNGDIVTLAGGMTVSVSTAAPASPVTAVAVYGYGTAQPAITAGATTTNGSGSGCTITVTLAPTSYLIGIQYPTAIDSSTATDITGVPENMHYAVILYSAIQSRIKQISDTTDSMQTLISATLSSVSALITSPMTVVADLSISTQLTAMETALTEQDIELVTANINDVQVRIQEWKTRVDARKTEFDADMQKAKEEFDGTVARVSSDLGTLKARIESYTQKLAGYTVGLKELQSEYHGLINLYLGKTQQQGQVN